MRASAKHFGAIAKASASVSQMVKNGNKLVFDQDSSGKDMTYIKKKKGHVLHPEQTNQ